MSPQAPGSVEIGLNQVTHTNPEASIPASNALEIFFHLLHASQSYDPNYAAISTAALSLIPGKSMKIIFMGSVKKLFTHSACMKMTAPFSRVRSCTSVHFLGL
jgi:hypothetical protein